MTRTGALRVVAVSGSLQSPSKTSGLLDAIAGSLGSRLLIEVDTVALTELGPELTGAFDRDRAGIRLEAALRRIEDADVLIVASPVYRAAVSGLFKHLFDLVDHRALSGTPVLLAATGGSERHSLILEHHLRPLFSFFQAVTLPLGVYGAEAEFADHRISDAALLDRVERAVERGVPLIRWIHPWSVARGERATGVA